MNGEKTTRRNFIKLAAVSGVGLCAERATAEVAENANGRFDIAQARQKRNLNRLSVSAIGFGCMGLNHNRSAHPDKKAETALLREAVERGITLFDTAESYGYQTNEKLVGEALRGLTDRVFVSSKFGHKFVNGVQIKTAEDSSPANIRRVCENSLRNLGVEALGIFYQHRIDPKTPIETVAETVAALIKEGKVLGFGLCEVNADTIRCAHAVCPLTAVQSEYHIMHRNVEFSGVLKTCRELGIGFVPYSPLNRGFLGGAINEWTRFDPNNDNRQTLPRFRPGAIRENTKFVAALDAFGRPRGLTSAQVALAWLLNREPFIVPIPGTTKIAHLEENLRASEVKFSSDEMLALENAISKIPVVGSRYDALQESKVQK